MFMQLRHLSIEAYNELQIKQSSPRLEHIFGFIVSKGLRSLAPRGSVWK